MADDYPVPELAEASMVLTLARAGGNLGRAVLDAAMEINLLRAENAALRKAGDALSEAADELALTCEDQRATWWGHGDRARVMGATDYWREMAGVTTPEATP